MKKIVCAIISAAALMATVCIGVSAQEYYVDGPNGKKYATGSKQDPFKTIQEAADIVQAGDTVIIRNGIYYENVQITKSGTKENPIIFRAEEFGNGKVIITGADRRIRENKSGDVWELYDAEKNIYRTKYERSNMLMRFLYNGQDIYMYPTYEGLETYVTVPTENANYLLGYKHGYYMDCDNGYLYVRLREDEKYGSVNPNKNQMIVSSERYMEYTEKDGTVREALQASAIMDDSYNVGVITEKPAHVVLYGITFEAPGFAGVYVRGSDVTVSNCWFVGVTCGVKGGSRHTFDNYVSKNVTIEYCDWHQSPTMDDALELLRENWNNPLARARSTYWFLKKVTSPVVSYLASTYSYETGGLTGSMGENWVMRNNYVHDCFEGVSWYSNWLYTEKYNGTQTNRQISGKNHQFYENRFENCVDNAIEMEFNANGFDVHHNEFVNVPDTISVQMGRGQPFSTNIRLHHNLIYNEYEWATAWYTHASKPDVPWSNMAGFFKIGMPTSEFKNPQEWMSNEPWNYTIDGPLNTPRWSDSGMKIYNNTMYGPYSYIFNNIGFFALELTDPNVDHNVELKNNIVSVMSKYEESGSTRQWLRVGDSAESRGGFSYGRNLFVPYRDASKPENSRMFITPNSDDPLFSNGGKLIMNEADAKMEDPKNYKFELKKDSPARGMGEQIPWETVDTTDAGAIKYGDKWDIKYAPYPFGDINCDGKLDTADIASVSSLSSVTESSTFYNERADLDFNGIINGEDMKLLIKEITGSEVK